MDISQLINNKYSGFQNKEKCMPMPPNTGRSERTGGNLAK